MSRCRHTVLSACILMISCGGTQPHPPTTPPVSPGRDPTSTSPPARELPKPEELVVDPNWFYISTPRVWYSAEDQTTYPFRGYDRGRDGWYLHEEVAVFAPDGTCGLLSTSLFYEPEARQVSFASTEGYSFRRGRWTRNEDGSLTVILVEQGGYKVARPSASSERPSSRIEPALVEQWVVRGTVPGRIGAVLQSPAVTYVPAIRLGELRLTAWTALYAPDER